MAFIFRQAVYLQSLGNDVLVEDGRVGTALCQNLTGPFQVQIRHFLRIAQPHGRIDQADIGNHVHAQQCQLIGHKLTVPVAPAHHVAAGQAAGHTVVDLDSQAVQEHLGLVGCDFPRVQILLVIGQQILIRMPQLELLGRKVPLRIHGQAIGDKMHGLHRLPEALRRVLRHAAADAGQLQKLLPPLSIGLIKLFIDAPADALDALLQQQIIIYRHMGILSIMGELFRCILP